MITGGAGETICAGELRSRETFDSYPGVWEGGRCKGSGVSVDGDACF